MFVTISEEAKKRVNRFKTLSVDDVEIVAEHFVEQAEEFCESAMGGVCFEKYDEDNNVTLFMESDDGDELIVRDVRRGNLAGVF